MSSNKEKSFKKQVFVLSISIYISNANKKNIIVNYILYIYYLAHF